MTSLPWKLFVTLLSAFHWAGLVHGQCIRDQSPIVMNETKPEGFLLLNGTMDQSDGPPLVHANTNGLSAMEAQSLRDNYFNLTTYPAAGYFTVSLAKPLDLEGLHKTWHNASFEPINLLVTCGKENELKIEVIIVPVNDFAPEFIHGPYSITISESTPVHKTVFDFGTRVKDQDFRQGTQLIFVIQDYRDSAFDGKDRFRFPNSAGGGHLELFPTQIDYDTLQRKFFILNISVKDSSTSGAKTGVTTMNISIADADDQVPEFVVPGCQYPCTYEALTTLDHVGDLIVTPVPISAIDHDTLGTEMLFTIDSGNDHGLFSIDESTGSLTQPTSVRNSGSDAYEFRLVIQVRKNITVDRHAIAIVRIGVKERLPFHNGTAVDPGTPHQEDGDGGGGSDLLIPMIVLGVVLALVIVATIVVALIIRWKQKKAAIWPEDGASVASYKLHKSEPATEEEEIFSDRSEQFITQPHYGEGTSKSSGVTAVGTESMFPQTDGMARRLPPLPLKDTGTGTETAVKKKRSRNRKKKKMTEIFDGTQEYNMGVDPAFYETTDKTKVKRSQRSYNKNPDPLYWMKVPNDNAD